MTAPQKNHQASMIISKDFLSLLSVKLTKPEKLSPTCYHNLVSKSHKSLTRKLAMTGEVSCS